MLKNRYAFWLGLLATAAIAFAGGMWTENSYRTPKNTKNLTIYGMDTQANTVETDLYVSFDSKLNQTQQLEKLSTLISRYKFCDLPIEIKSLQNGIATVNLDEHAWVKTANKPPAIPGCSGKSWRYGYFQGSAGGYATTVTLTRSFVQPNDRGNWIKGVQFYYAGQPIKSGDWDHIQLDGVITRENLP
ncbi:hypothetical protein [Brunnivagina elsteri]|uniref:DUF2808 domain-containing protein n=1 Tax=Brunnivagina elsteri CCALA 953 TaxID=987040 RepID=A0A2A2T9Z3_9CYAN|nr:hypothetical protein [Calothrix elsteri]PAX45813.1 hypothetical protein CK510_29700 [Calothrix elsteri CCALA 953]